MSEDLVQFEDFVLNRGAYELRRGDVVIPLQRIPLELLCLLVERRGQLVTREEILERVWGKGVFVDSENSINTAVRKVRQALNDDSEAPHFVAQRRSVNLAGLQVPVVDGEVDRRQGKPMALRILRVHQQLRACNLIIKL